jgi:lysophospholipid acyltransferase (LPLAT)-like uncharacterized protein
MAARLLRRIRSSAPARRLAARLITGYLRLCRATGRWEVLGAAHRDAARAANRPVILAIWHGRLAMVATERAPQDRVLAVISRAGDGAVIAGVMERFGIAALRGSSQDPAKPWRDRGGREAFAAALSAIRRDPGSVIAFSPDGPRGPRMRCQPGIALLAARTGVAVLPFAFSVRRGVELGSWDRFLLPLPFTRGVIAWGPPIAPPDDADEAAVERHRSRIEAALTDLTRAADARLGRTTPEPG